MAVSRLSTRLRSLDTLLEHVGDVLGLRLGVGIRVTLVDVLELLLFVSDASGCALLLLDHAANGISLRLNLDTLIASNEGTLGAILHSLLGLDRFELLLVVKELALTLVSMVDQGIDLLDDA